MRTACRWLVVPVLVSFLSGCGGSSASQTPTETDQAKVQNVSKDLATKFGYPSAKGMRKTPPKRR